MLSPISNFKIEAAIARYQALLQDHIQYFRKWVDPQPIAITGSYNTTNIGDISIGIALQQGLASLMSVRSSLYGLHHKQFDGSKLIVWAGGDSLHDSGSMKKLEHLVRLSESPLIISAVGVPGIISDEGKRLLKELLDRVKYISVRDDESYQKLSGHVPNKYLEKISVTADLAFLLKQFHSFEHVIPKKGYVGISARALDLPTGRTWIKEKHGWTDKEIELLQSNSVYTVRQCISYVKKNSMNPVFIPFDAEDLLFFHSFLSDLNITCMPLLRKPQKLLDFIASMDYMICTRYHSIIFAIITQTPMFVISYADKTDALIKLLPGVSYTDRKKFCEFVEPDFTVSRKFLNEIGNQLSLKANQNCIQIREFWQKIT